MGFDAEAPRLVPNDASSRAEFVYNTLREAIHSGEFRPNERLRETDIAQWLGVSRTPVREALKRLESNGLVVFAPPRGLVVAELDQQQVQELYALREVLEGLASRLAAQFASDAEVRGLRDILAREASIPDDQPQALAQINRQFHQVLYRAARNRYLLDALNALRDAEALLTNTTFAVVGRPSSAYQEHVRLVDAIERRDPDLAEEMARAHIRQATEARLTLLFRRLSETSEVARPLR